MNAPSERTAAALSATLATLVFVDAGNAWAWLLLPGVVGYALLDATATEDENE